MLRSFHWQPRRRVLDGRGRHFRPRLEALEARALLSVCTVDRLTDTGEGEKLSGDLRYCITQANELPSDDTITFDVTGTIYLSSVLPDLSSNIDLQGPGAGLLTVRRETGGSYRIFTVASGATVILSDMTITNGFPLFSGEGGAGISNSGTLTLNNAIVTGNGNSDADQIYGGGIFSRGTLTLNYSTVSDNHAGFEGSGGGIYNEGGTLTLNHSILSGNIGEIGGGGILNSGGPVTLNHSTVSGNAAYPGGGISNWGTFTLNHSTVSGNIGAVGGGISNSGTLTLNQSTVSGNTEGGGVYNAATLMVSSSTISGNGSRSSQSAGGITNSCRLSRDATVQLVNSTIAGNTNPNTLRTGSQIYTGRFSGTCEASVRFRNTIVSGSGPRPNFFADIGGMFVSEGHNLSSDDSGDLDPKRGDLPSTDPLLRPLQDNGGPTRTHALLPGSPALDAGDNTDAPKFDQRGEGFPRIVADTIDIGAFEVQPGPATWFWLDAPAEAATGVPFDVTLFALDDYGHLATGYEGTVTFFTTDKDPGVLLPADYTFTADDQGIHTFTGETILVTPGEQYLWALDADAELWGEAVLTVVPSGAPGGQGGRRGTVPDGALATDLARVLTRRAARADEFWAALPAEPGPWSAGRSG